MKVRVKDWEVLPIPDGLSNNPIDIKFYIGRIKDIVDDETFLLTIWEVPGLRELYAAPSRGDNVSESGSLLINDPIYIWIWSEMVNNLPIEKLHIQSMD